LAIGSALLKILGPEHENLGMRTAYSITAAVFTLLTLVSGYWCTRIRWAPRIDFDILGFLWLVQNIPQLTLVLMTFCFAGLTVYCWMRSAVD
jgi:hypothetical protein